MGRSRGGLTSKIHAVVDSNGLPVRLRVLIDATFPGADLRQKSRWVRALEYLASEDVPAQEFKRFIRANGGLAGCARLTAEVNRKRRRPGGDWND